jgi:hypothetical protein
MEQETMYMKKGQVIGAVGAVIYMIVGVGVAVMILIFVGLLGGKTYNLVETDINAITNTTIRDSVKNGVISGFEALESTGDFLPIIVLAIVITVILGLVLGLTALSGQGGMRGSAL